MSGKKCSQDCRCKRHQNGQHFKGKGRVLSDITRERIAASKRGVPRDVETCEKISRTLTGRKNGTHTQVTKDKISHSLKGFTHSEEFKHKCKERQERLWTDPEYRRQQIELLRWTEERRQRESELWTEERRQQFSEEQKQRYAEDRPKWGCPRGHRFDRSQGLGRYVGSDGYVYLTMLYDHPLTGVNSELGEHRKVLYDTIGPGSHECYWGCGRILEWGGWDGIQADHLDDNKQNNIPDNLVPSCIVCNTLRGRV